MDAYLIGVDIGTQGTKTCLYHQDGTLKASAFEGSKLIEPKPGAMEQCPEDMLGSVVRTIHTVMTSSGVSPEAVAAIGMDGQMAGILGIDDDFNAVTPYDSWLDTRCQPEIQIMRQEAGKQVISITGAPVSYTHGPKILRWKREYPEVYQKIAKFVLPVTYIAGKMCGLTAEDAWIDYTCLHFSGFGDVQKLCWSDDLLQTFQVDQSKMPRISAPWEVIGKLTAEFAETCGLREGIPICAGAGDQAATAFGAGIVREGLAFDVAGTASVFSCCTSVFAPDTENETILYARSVLPNLWIPLAYIGGGGLCLRWIRDILARGRSDVTYDTLSEEAAKITPGSDGLIFIPHFSGRVCPHDPYVKGSYLGLSYRHTGAHLYRAVMESIAYEYDQYRNILYNSTKITPKETHVIGGGAKSELFNQIKADVLSSTYKRLEVTDTATWGSAALAGYSIGLYAALADEVQRHALVSKVYEPCAENHDIYTHFSHVYALSIESLHTVYQEL